MSKREEVKTQKQKFKNPRALFFVLFVSCFFLSLYGCNNASNNEGSKKEDSNKFKQYYVQGEKLYLQHCSNCHQKDGSGLGKLYPPLNKSDYLNENFDQVLCLMRYGIEGELIVNNISFNQPMPGVPTLTDLEIAEIATYIYNSWSNKRGIVDVKDASLKLQQCETSKGL